MPPPAACFCQSSLPTIPATYFRSYPCPPRTDETRRPRFCFAFVFRELRRTYVPPPVPVIEPINDDYLAGFARSYADAKNRTEADADRGDGEGSGSDGGGSSSSHSDSGDDGVGKKDGGNDDAKRGDHGPSADKASEGVDGGGGGAAAGRGADALGSPSGGGSGGGGGGTAPATPKSSLSAGRKKHGVFALNLPYELCQEEKLENIFNGFGRITAVVLSRPPEGRT